MTGITEIELTDVKTGEKECYVEKNMVTNAVADLLKGVPPFYLPTEISTNFFPLWQKAMGGVVLFDSTLEENADKYFEPYNVKKVGYASNGASNLTDPKRGSRNVLESEVLENGVKMVWDFTTAQANGTIKSVCLTSSKGGEGEYGSDAGFPLSYERFITPNMHSNSSSYAIEMDSPPVSVEYDKLNKTYQLVSLYQESSAIVIRKYNYPTGDISQTTANLVFYEQQEEISIDYSNPKSLSAGYLTFADGHDGYWYGFYSAGNKSGSASLYAMKISKEDYSITELGSQTLSGCTIVMTRRNYYVPIVANGYVYIPKCDLNASSSYILYYASATVYKISLSNFADITEIVTGDAISQYADSMTKGVLPNGAIAYGDRVIYPNDSCITMIALAGDKRWYDDSYYASLPFISFRTFLIAGIESGGDSLACVVVNPYYLATINNLSSPITKTADKTMKITYTLTYE